MREASSGARPGADVGWLSPLRSRTWRGGISQVSASWKSISSTTMPRRPQRRPRHTTLPRTGTGMSETASVLRRQACGRCAHMWTCASGLHGVRGRSPALVRRRTRRPRPPRSPPRLRGLRPRKTLQACSIQRCNQDTAHPSRPSPSILKVSRECVRAPSPGARPVRGAETAPVLPSVRTLMRRWGRCAPAVPRAG